MLAGPHGRTALSGVTTAIAARASRLRRAGHGPRRLRPAGHGRAGRTKRSTGASSHWRCGLLPVLRLCDAFRQSRVRRHYRARTLRLLDAGTRTLHEWPIGLGRSWRRGSGRKARTRSGQRLIRLGPRHRHAGSARNRRRSRRGGARRRSENLSGTGRKRHALGRTRCCRRIGASRASSLTKRRAGGNLSRRRNRSAGTCRGRRGRTLRTGAGSTRTRCYQNVGSALHRDRLRGSRSSSRRSSSGGRAARSGRAGCNHCDRGTELSGRYHAAGCGRGRRRHGGLSLTQNWRANRESGGSARTNGGRKRRHQRSTQWRGQWLRFRRLSKNGRGIPFSDSSPLRRRLGFRLGH